MAETTNSVKGLWQSLTTAQRAGIAFVMIAALAFVGFISWFGNRPEWRVVVRDAEPRDAQDMVAALEQAGIPVQVSGSAIAVSADKVSDAFREFAKKQLPKSGVGLEIFDATTLSWTSFLEQTNLRRGTQGEIERTLRTWPGIASAKVLISNEKQGIWTRGDKDGSASVSVASKPGAHVSPGDIAAIQSFVASTWSSLTPDRVTVVVDGQRMTRDTQGTAKAELAQATDQLLAKQEFENLLRRKAQDALDLAEGTGKTVVSVNADLDFESREEKSATIDPGSKVTMKEETSSTTHTGSGETQTAGGPPGASSNLPGADPKAANPAATPAVAAAPLEKTDTGKTEFDYSRTTKVSRKNGFDVKRLTVALMADKSLAPRLTKLENVVKSAVGFDQERKDLFSSTADAEFPKPEAVGGGAVPAGQPVESSNLIPMIETGGRIAVLLGLVGLFLMLVKRANGRGPARAPVFGAPAGGGAYGTNDVAVGVPAGPTPEQLARNVAKNAATAALSDPVAAGRVIRNWIETDSSR